MIKETSIPLFDMLMCLSNAMDLVSPVLVDHHKRVAYISASIAAEFGLSKEEQNNLLLAGMLHDSGALSLKERLEVLRFDLEGSYRHMELGYRLLKNFEPFSKVATLVRFHHVPWDKGRGSMFMGEQVPLGSHILHLADRASVLIETEKPVLTQVAGIYERIQEKSGSAFVPEFVEAFQSLATKEYFWLDAVSPSINSVLARRARLMAMDLDLDGLLSLAKLFGQIIDFRSPFTATHSNGVAATAEVLAKFMGLSERECRMMKIAGDLHDLGKLAVPVEFLEKMEKLTEDEFAVVKSHAFYTYRILETISDLDIINVWCSFHHERLDGKGYPFHYKGQDLSLGSRIIAVADVFTAITEDRPYRKGMSNDQAVQVLQQMVKDLALDANVVSALMAHYDEVNAVREVAQSAVAKEFQIFEQ
ncbi:MAG: HD domain-containing protein [Firmicutes bacterium]|nr:HD domain-containing protein [Bacillota bacterium]